MIFEHTLQINFMDTSCKIDLRNTAEQQAITWANVDPDLCQH